MPLSIRPESPADIPAIFAVTEAAFRTAAHSAGTEQFIVNALRDRGAFGCMLAGDPAYYRRFGFQPVPELTYPGVPPEYFMAVSFGPPLPRGAATFHVGFSATA